jgi:hypothetical protein
MRDGLPVGLHVLQAELDGFADVVQRPVDCVALAVAAWKRGACGDGLYPAVPARADHDVRRHH